VKGLPDKTCLMSQEFTCPQYGQASPHENVAPTYACTASPCPEHTASSQIGDSLSGHATL